MYSGTVREDSRQPILTSSLQAVELGDRACPASVDNTESAGPRFPLEGCQDVRDTPEVGRGRPRQSGFRSHERLEDFVLGVVVGGDVLPDVNLKQRGLLDFHTIGTALARRL